MEFEVKSIAYSVQKLFTYVLKHDLDNFLLISKYWRTAILLKRHLQVGIVAINVIGDEVRKPGDINDPVSWILIVLGLFKRWKL